ncbi:glycosyltransferase family protein [Chlorobium ferrooxidans]|uniref:Glycosyl transferase, family 9 n=1 Tax=Chlorobium ferrooxidans DSM 13031 TaxID=377431 RepID=Q0YSI0_9CHLB|nr:hypothetical protein [Chlorobium ferrooxidans]EAT59219.1 hypothetical protein CferDRAFT_1226 [Chlorobium ferrooxidans DSM 13031]
MRKKAAVVSRGWLGDTIACSAAASSLCEKGYETTFFIRWPQLKPIFDNDRRFVTRLYGRFLTYKISRPLFGAYYDVVIREPKSWSYKEPFTSEIRRIAGCEPVREYTLKLSAAQMAMTKINSSGTFPVIAMARDTYKRAYGRDVDALVAALSHIADIHWVGLSQEMDSKKGKNVSLVRDASLICHSDLFVGPEGGLLWVAAGLGTRCVYFTEHIAEISKNSQKGDPANVLGCRNHFEDSSHIDLPAYCSNDFVVKKIVEILQIGYQSIC